MKPHVHGLTFKHLELNKEISHPNFSHVVADGDVKPGRGPRDPVQGDVRRWDVAGSRRADVNRGRRDFGVSVLE